MLHATGTFFLGDPGMWKLLPFCLLLVSCATNDQHSSAADDAGSEQARIVRVLELPLRSDSQSGSGGPERRTFETQGIQGWVDANGSWSIQAEVRHGRLRCGSYETGIQVGRGNPACSGVEWLTDSQFVTRVRHCNGATRIHAGSGVFSSSSQRIGEATCVRVAVRCAGSC
jgi:hypothetical protein